MNPEKIHAQLVKGLQKFFKKTGFQKAVIGLSGGIDSALTLKIAVDALGGENITGLIMPETGLTKDENTYHARTLADFFKVKHYTIPINKFLLDFGLLPWKGSERAHMNTKARIRMILLYHFANTFNTLVLGTSNKSEIMLGYGTKYGDFAADVEIIAELFKEEVYQLSKYLELPDEFIQKPPSAELSHNQTDENELGAGYHEIDQILKRYTMGKEALLERGMNPGLINGIIQRIEENRHKTELPEILKIKDDE